MDPQYLLLCQPLRTHPTLDAAISRGHRLTYLEKVYQNKMDPQYLLLSQPLHTHPTLDAAISRGHRPTSPRKNGTSTENKRTRRGTVGSLSSATRTRQHHLPLDKDMKRRDRGRDPPDPALLSLLVTHHPPTHPPSVQLSPSHLARSRARRHLAERHEAGGGHLLAQGEVEDAACDPAGGVEGGVAHERQGGKRLLMTSNADRYIRGGPREERERKREREREREKRRRGQTDRQTDKKADRRRDTETQSHRRNDGDKGGKGEGKSQPALINQTSEEITPYIRHQNIESAPGAYGNRGWVYRGAGGA